MQRVVTGLAAIAFVAFLALPQVASAQYSQSFDGLNGSATGVVLTGQDGFFIPAGTTSTDFLCYTYAGNILGIPQNPEGGTKFIGGTGPAGGMYARAQRDVDFGPFGEGTWAIEYDFGAHFVGAPPSSQNVGSFSIRQEPNTFHIHLFTWVDPNNPTTFNAFYMPYDVGGVQFPQPGASPGPQWENLAVDHWYHARTVYDLDSNLITEVAIRDISGGGSETVYYPDGWYLYGGGGGHPFPPEAFRFFGGGGTYPGNTTVWDNMAIREPGPVGEGACCAPDGTCTITTQSQCQGTYMGDGTVCDPNPCQQPTGACCFTDGTCQVMTADDCAAHGGSYLGNGTVCVPNPCPPPVPTQETSWGAIKHLYH